MKTKAKIIFKSLADLPGNTLALAAGAPGRAVQITRHIVTPPMRATRRHFRIARQRSASVFQDIYRRANTPFQFVQPWSRGGLNE